MVLVCSSVAVLVAMACPVQPQDAAPTSAPVISATSAKHAAILGAPSALQQILMQQAGTAPVAGTTMQQANLTPAAGGTLFPVRPAIIERSYSAPAAYGWTPASPDRPDVFGSSAMPIAKTALDAKWRRATASFASAASISRQLPQAEGTSAMAKLQLVNSWVNRHVQFVSDIRSSGQADRWSGAAETLRRGEGDCEDYAITKLQLLKALGISGDDLYLSVVRDLVRHADHAVLVVRIDGRFVVLDNNVDRVLDTQEVADYRPVITYSASGKAWLHGYRQSVQLASVSTTAVPASAQ